MKYVSILLINMLTISLSHAQDTTLYNLTYSTFLGGGHFEQARDIAVDAEGNFYITGGTSSANFPVTQGAYDTVYNNAGSATVGGWGPMMVFVTKFSAEGELIWSTYLGGPNYDRAYAIEVDAAGYVYIGGRAGANFPTTPGAFQETFTQQAPINNLYGHQNGFISKLSPDGAELIWSTYYGSDSFGFFRDIDIDEEGYVYGILNAVKTLPQGIPDDAYDTSLNGNYDMVPVKFSQDGSEVVWATVLGGSGEDRGGPSIRVGPDKSVYVAGGTRSTDWPVTPNAVQTQAGGQSDLFITRIAADGKSLIYSTYFGGSNNEFSETHCLEVDHLGQAHIAGGTDSEDVTTTANAIKASKPASDGFDALLAKFSVDGTQLLASTYIGGAGEDFAEGLYVDTLGNFYVGGATESEDFQVTDGALQMQWAGGSDGFVVKVNPAFDTLIYSTYLGGEDEDAVRAFHLSNEGVIGFSGQTESEDFPLTSNAFQTSIASTNRADSYFVMLEPEVIPVITLMDQPAISTDIKLFPNPTYGYVNLISAQAMEYIYVWSIDGQLLARYDGNQKSINLSSFASGFYVIEVHLKTGERIRKPLVIRY